MLRAGAPAILNALAPRTAGRPLLTSEHLQRFALRAAGRDPAPHRPRGASALAALPIPTGPAAVLPPVVTASPAPAALALAPSAGRVLAWPALPLLAL